MLIEASLYIGCDAGVERPIGASDDVDLIVYFHLPAGAAAAPDASLTASDLIRS